MAWVWKRIDRTLASAECLHCFSGHQVQHLSKIVSDHCPILITIDGLCMPKSPFHFEKFWTFYRSSWDLTREMWRMPIHGDVRYQVSRRLELTGHRLLRWNPLEVGDIFRNIKGVETNNSELQMSEDQEDGL